MNYIWSIGRLLKDSKILQVETGKDLTTALYSKTTKPENLFDKKSIIKITKVAKRFYAYKR